MNKKRLVTTVSSVVVALAVASTGIASAHDGMGKGLGNGAGLSNFLNELVGKGTISQSQADAIAKALKDKAAAKDADRAADRAAKEAVITSTLGIDATTLRTRLQAGESLATIAGAKKDALIAAIVAFETKEIDAKVTAGKITAAQATTLKANLTARVTDMVNSVKGPGMGKRGGMHGDKGNGSTGTLVTPNSGTSTTSTAKYVIKNAKVVKA
jgi:polyhydroxyalkanoate synthesis regulator phasin